MRFMTWHGDNLSTEAPSGGPIVSEAPTSDVLMLSWELARPGHAPVLSPCGADTGNSRPGSPRTCRARGSGTGLLTVTCYLRSDLGSGIMSGQVSRDNSRPSLMEIERERGYWQVAPLNPDRLNVTSDWPDLYLRGNLVTLLILNSFLDRRFQCGSHVWCIVIILDQHNILALYSVSWVGCGCGDNGQVQVSLVVTVCLGPSWVNTRQCDCLSVMIIRCQSVSPSVKMSNFNITTWHDINIYPVS